jgi:molybdopterin-biosynthesis enzyme MoeA-like protein
MNMTPNNRMQLTAPRGTAVCKNGYCAACAFAHRRRS